MAHCEQTFSEVVIINRLKTLTSVLPNASIA